MDLDSLLEQVAHSAALKQHADWFRRWLRPAIAITTSSLEGRLGESRFGGPADMPVGSEWPRHRKGPYRFLAQLDLAELPIPAGWPEPWCELPRRGLLSLFAGDDPTGTIDPSAEMFWGNAEYAIAFLSEPQTALASLSPPEEVDFGSPIGMTFSPTIDFPDSRELVPEFPFSFDEGDDLRRLRKQLGNRWHLFGYPTFSSLGYDPTPAEHWPLMTLDSDKEREWEWHDGDWLMLFFNPSVVRAGQFPLRSDAG